MIRLLAIFLYFSATSVAALDPDLPALFEVTGVASDDVLNTRHGPGLNFKTTGSLQHDRRDVEVVAIDDSGSWGLTNIGEQARWVSMKFLTLQPGQIEGTFPEFLNCFGTEPFWNAEIAGSNVIMQQLGKLETKHSNLWRTQSMSHIGRLGFGAGNLTGLIQQRSCNDGMSDREYGYSIDLLTERGPGTQILSGCCSLN